VRRAVAVLALVVLAATGCGGGDQRRSDYVKSLNRAQTGLAKRFTALQARITPTSTAAQDERTLQAYAGAVRDAVRDLRAVSPPAGFEALHQRCVGQVADYGTALQSARTQLRSDDPQRILAAQGRLRAAIEQTGARLNATIRAINAKLKG
jgi:type VI protein secretion system component VasF